MSWTIEEASDYMETLENRILLVREPGWPDMDEGLRELVLILAKNQVARLRKIIEELKENNVPSL